MFIDDVGVEIDVGSVDLVDGFGVGRLPNGNKSLQAPGR